MGALRGRARVEGEVRFRGTNLLGQPAGELRRLWGRRLAMVFQDPTSTLNPVLTVGEQLIEVLREHEALSARQAEERALALFAAVRLPHPGDIARRYPHQLSGGQQQRVSIAIALACDPDVLVLDEPTTGLDVTTEARILDLVESLRQRSRAAILYISHNLGVIHRLCDEVAVMYAGEVVEQGPAGRSSRGRAIPTPSPSSSACRGSTRRRRPGCCQRSRALSRTQRGRPTTACSRRAAGWPTERCRAEHPGWVEAAPGTTRAASTRTMCRRPPGVWSGRWTHRTSRALPHALCSKSTASSTTTGRRRGPGLGSPDRPRARRRLASCRGRGDAGRRRRERLGQDDARPRRGGTPAPDRRAASGWTARPFRTPGAWRRALRRRLQIVFQNPDLTLNPRRTILEAVARPLELFGLTDRRSRRAHAARLLEAVGLGERYLDVYPNQISGGQRQRVAIARAFACRPDLVVCDEPTSALDVSVQATVLNLLASLQARERSSYLFISHDLSVVRHIADRVAVLYLGRVCEVGRTEDVFTPPCHPYTEMLLLAVPSLSAGPVTATPSDEGPAPDPAAPPSGCPFHPRCPRKLGPICEVEAPPLTLAGQGHAIACHIPPDELRRLQTAERLARDRDDPRASDLGR